jgi:hypothetical protein
METRGVGPGRRGRITARVGVGVLVIGDGSGARLRDAHGNSVGEGEGLRDGVEGGGRDIVAYAVVDREEAILG